MNHSLDGGHWPRFATLCGMVSDRDRLGLPDRFVAARFDSERPAMRRSLHGTCPDRLREMIEESTLPLLERLVAGDMLAELGDDRLDVLRPRMVDIPGACVAVGTPLSEIESIRQRFDGLGLDASWLLKECPRHTLDIPAFRLATYPVTNLEYRAFLDDCGYPVLPDSWCFRRFPAERSNHPVYTLRPQDCDAYVQWLAERTGRRFRLPTEAEWEYAATGTDGREFPWGDTFDIDRANTCEAALFQTSPVGAFVTGASPFGVMDMAGNIEEYVADEYAPYPGGAGVADHLVEIHGSYRVARGGCFARFRDLARTRRRHGHNPRSRVYAMGFRIAESLS